MTDKQHQDTAPEFGLNDHTLSQIRDIFKSHPEVEEAVLYGFRAKGTHRPGSI